MSVELRELVLRYIEHFKQLSATIQQNCQQFDIQFIDTSENWVVAMQTAYDFAIARLGMAAS